MPGPSGRGSWGVPGTKALPVVRAYEPTQRFGLTGVDPATVLSDTGVLTITGYAPTILTPRVMRPGVGALILTGVVPAIRVPRVVVPAVGALALVGLAPTVLTPQVARPGVGVLTLTGLAPLVLTPRVAQPGVGALVVAGFAPVVMTPQTVRPDAGALTLVGFAPTVVIAGSVTVVPGVGALTIEGYAPTVTGDPVADLPTGGVFGIIRRRKIASRELVIEGFAPTVVIAPAQRFRATPVARPAVVSAGTGALALEGFAPTVAVVATVPVVAPQPEHEPDATGEPISVVVRPAGIEQAARASFPIYQPDDQGHAQPTHFSGPLAKDSAAGPAPPAPVPAWLASPIVVDVGYAVLLLDGFAPTVSVTTRATAAEPWSPESEDDAAILWAAYDLLVNA